MLQAGIYASAGGALLLDISTRASQLVITNGEHGFGTLTCFVRMSLAESFQLYDRPGIPHVQLSEFGMQVWAGRLEDVAIVAGGVRLTALGYWRAFSDMPYFAVFSTTRVGDWEVLKITDDNAIYNERYQLDTNNRLFITPVKGNTYGNTGVGNKHAELGYRGLDQGLRQIVACSFTYDLTMPANWKAYLQSADSAWVRGTVQWSLAGNGAQQTGTQTLTFTGTDRLVFLLRFEAADAAYAPETGINYLKITNLRVQTTTAVPLAADTIATGMVNYVTSINSAQLSSSAALILSPAVDLTDEVYADVTPAAILDRLAYIGNSATPPVLFETGVWDNQILSFQKRGTTARTWYVDISALELERTIDQLYNDVYADYQEAGGHTLRSATNADSNSKARYGLMRRKMVQTSTTSSTLAATTRDAALQDGKDPRPRIKITFDRVFDGAGSVSPLWMVRAWDQVVIRNLPLTLSASLDRIRTFRVIETRYDVDKNVLTVTPEQFVPSLAVLTARNAAGIRR